MTFPGPRIPALQGRACQHARRSRRRPARLMHAERQVGAGLTTRRPGRRGSRRTGPLTEGRYCAGALSGMSSCRLGFGVDERGDGGVLAQLVQAAAAGRPDASRRAARQGVVSVARGCGPRRGGSGCPQGKGASSQEVAVAAAPALTAGSMPARRSRTKRGCRRATPAGGGGAPCQPSPAAGTRACPGSQR